jgi:hypothetical protein
MSAGNLTNGTLSVKTLYVDGVSIPVPVGSGVASFNGLVGDLTVTSTGGSIVVSEVGNSVDLYDDLKNNLGSTPASPNSTTLALAIPGLTTSSQVIVNLGPGDANGGYILYAVPTADTLTVTFSIATSNPTTTAVIDFWWVNSPN